MKNPFGKKKLNKRLQACQQIHLVINYFNGLLPFLHRIQLSRYGIYRQD